MAPGFSLKVGRFPEHAWRQPNRCKLRLRSTHNATDHLPRNLELARDFGSRKGF